MFHHVTRLGSSCFLAISDFDKLRWSHLPPVSLRFLTLSLCFSLLAIFNSNLNLSLFISQLDQCLLDCFHIIRHERYISGTYCGATRLIQLTADLRQFHQPTRAATARSKCCDDEGPSPFDCPVQPQGGHHFVLCLSLGDPHGNVQRRL